MAPVRRAVASLLRSGRSMRSAASGWRGARGANVVLSYHRIRPASGPPSATAAAAARGMVVTEVRFRRQLEALAERYEVVKAVDARRRSDRPRAAITFDDGYADNAEVAVPVLHDLGLPATFFVTTDGLGRGTEFWWDQLEHVLLSTRPVPPRLRLLAAQRPLDLATATPAERQAAFTQLTRLLRASPPKVVDDVLDELVGATGGPPEPCDAHRRLSPAQLRTLADDPLFDVGSHTCSHAALRALPRSGSRAELRRSRAALSEVLGHPPALVAFPYGAPPSVGRRDRGEARRAGYELAFINTPGSADRSRPFAVHRVPVQDWEPEELLAAAGAWLAPPGRRRLRRR